MKKLLIIDINSGNLNSLYYLIKKKITNDVIIGNSKKSIKEASHIILPGVGSFPNVMEKLNKNICVKTLKENILIKKKPFLGICIGMQVLYSSSNEFGYTKGLNILKGKVLKLKRPNIGWMTTRKIKNNKIFLDNHDLKEFYFLHRFYVKSDKNTVVKTKNGIASVVNYKNIYGIQFHPENSHNQGREILNNFLNI